MEPVERFEHSGVLVTIGYEEDASFADPRDSDNLGTMFCRYPGYSLGDGGVELPDLLPDRLYEHLRSEHGATVILPLFVYEHSGIMMRAGENLGSTDPRGKNPFDTAAWDTSMVGFIFDTPEQRRALGCEDHTPEAIERILRAEVHVYDLYLRGEVYLFDIKSPEGEMLDSCGGFLGYDDVEDAARDAADAAAASLAHEAKLAAEWAARDVVTI